MELSKEQIHEIQKSITKDMIKKKQEYNDINLIIKTLNQANAFYLSGNCSKSEFIEFIIQAKDLMIKSLTE